MRRRGESGERLDLIDLCDWIQKRESSEDEIWRWLNDIRKRTTMVASDRDQSDEPRLMSGCHVPADGRTRTSPVPGKNSPNL